MSAEGPIILYVEDNMGDVVLVKTGFKRFQFFPRLDVVEDGTEAMDRLQRTNVARPDLLLLDLNLPRMNGFEVLTEMKKDAALTQIPVIVYSGSANPEDKVKALQGGAKQFVEKPRTIDDVLHLIQQIKSLF